MTQTHTPTPYRINDNDKRQVITGNRTGVIATCQSRENAAFIVRACNNHAALVEALKLVREAGLATNDLRRSLMFSEAMPKVLAALAAVEGK